MEKSKFKVGDKVLKVKGYSFPGEVRAVFTNIAGDVRIVVETTVIEGLLHLFNEDLFELDPFYHD